MWDRLPVQSTSQKSVPFSDWLARIVTDERLKEAEEALHRAEKKFPMLRSYRTTPQTPPHHSEGPHVVDGIRRALAVFYAVRDGISLLTIEELASRQHLHVEIEHMERRIAEHAATMELYLIVHDVGKSDTCVLDAPAGSRGAAEKFQQHKYRAKQEVSEEERRHYDKLFRAFAVRHADLSLAEKTAAFYDTYEIHAHYPGHAKWGAELLKEEFEDLADDFRLPAKDRALIRFLVRYHMEALMDFREEADPQKYEVFTARAQKAGLNADEALDLLAAGIFFDACAGSLPYEAGEFSPSVSTILLMLQAEEEVAPHRRRVRREQREQERERQFRAILQEAGLDGGAVFALLETPFGPERGRVMEEIRALIEDRARPIPFTQNARELEKRIEKARALFDERLRA